MFIPSKNSYTDNYFEGYSVLILFIAAIFFSVSILIPIYSSKKIEQNRLIGLSKKGSKIIGWILLLLSAIVEANK